MVPVGMRRWFELTIEFVDGAPVQLGPYGFSNNLSKEEFLEIGERMQGLVLRHT